MARAHDNPGECQPCDTSLQMDYWSEELTEAQQKFYSRADRELTNIMKKVEEFISKEKGEILEQGTDITILQGPEGTPAFSVLSNLVTPVPHTVGAKKPLNQVVTLQTQPQMPPLQPVGTQVQSQIPNQIFIQGGPMPAIGRVTRAAPIQPSQATFQTVQGGFQNSLGVFPTPAGSFQTTPGSFQTPPGTIQVVMDPRLGFLLGSLPSQPTPVNQITETTSAQQPSALTYQPPITVQSTSSLRIRPKLLGRSAVKSPVTLLSAPDTPVLESTLQTAVAAPAPSKTVATLKPKQKTPSSVPPPIIASSVQAPPLAPVPAPTPNPAAPAASSSVATATIPPSISKPSESNCIGGLCAGSQGSKRNSQDVNKGNANGPDSREVSFNKLSGKTYPSLVVLARPHLRVREMAQTKMNQERSHLDSKVKCVLMYTPTKFSEWLIQQGLVRSEQYCSLHSSLDGPNKLKLGMYSDVTKFPYSGGYVWISECCPHRFVSVFNGSIFEGAPHAPTVLLKLLYHWCCQTNVQNVVQWVKVDNLYVKNFFTYMRSVCVAAVHEKHEKLGGPQKKVEVGVISLGTTSQDGNMRQVKVEVLGVMDSENKLIRLRAVEPLQDGERNYKRRFVTILKPLEQWVHKDSIIITDFTVDKGTLMSMGFNQVHQSTIPEPPAPSNKLSNQNIMEYLRRIVPRMFQNTLSLLSRQIIQQFLDELVWRERWGPIPSQAFESLIAHLSAQTKLDTGETLLSKLSKIAANPFRKWDYSSWKYNGLQSLYASISEKDLPQQLALRPTSTPASSQRSSDGANQQVQNPVPENKDPEISKMARIAIPTVFEVKLDDDTENRVKMAISSMEKGMSLRKAVFTWKVPMSILLERARDVLKSKTGVGQGGVFTEDEEEDVKDFLLTLSSWGYTLGRWDIGLAVKHYLETCGRTECRFKDNFPGDLWIDKFLSRHSSIREKLFRNIPSRESGVDSHTVETYIVNLSSVLLNIPPENILNIMEIGLAGDPLRSMTVELREVRYPEGKKKVKSFASLMMACTATGKMLPSFIVFESKQPVNIEKGPVPGVYCGTRTGWFDELSFQKWLESVLLPWASRIPGKKIVIGDSLAQLFTVKTLALCKDNNISFMCMPGNITGVLSPIDVALSEKLRRRWRTQIRTWAASNGDKFVHTEDLPSLIHNLVGVADDEECLDKLKTAFKVVGLYPYSTKNAFQALQNGGVSMSIKGPNHMKQQQIDSTSRKRKQIFINSSDLILKKKNIVESSEPSEVKSDVGTDGKTEKDMTSIKREIVNALGVICLQEFYYGTRDGDAASIAEEFKIDNINGKCPLCRANVSDNIELMKHLFGHSDVNPCADELENNNQCRYCLIFFPSESDLSNHEKEVHCSLPSQTACLICSVKFENQQSMISHMNQFHVRLELPYVCGICNFRSSEQFRVVDHFYKAHSKGENVQCPFCLKCVIIAKAGKKIHANILFFMNHIRKHLVKHTLGKCTKCVLRFVQKGFMNHHQAKDHTSCKNDPNVLPYTCDSENRVIMPVPRPISDSDENKNDARQNYTSTSLDFLVISGFQPSSRCVECNASIDESTKHFVEHLSCCLCSFSTCCRTAMETHLKMFHSTGELVSIASAFLLPQDMHCTCGFKTNDGNLLAKHLVSCESYVSESSASTASHQSDLTSPSVSHGDPPDPSNTTNVPGLAKKNSSEETFDRLPLPNEIDNETEPRRDRPLSRGSASSSSSSTSRKRNSHEAGLTVGNKNVKRGCSQV